MRAKVCVVFGLLCGAVAAQLGGSRCLGDDSKAPPPPTVLFNTHEGATCPLTPRAGAQQVDHGARLGQGSNASEPPAPSRRVPMAPPRRAPPGLRLEAAAVAAVVAAGPDNAVPAFPTHVFSWSSSTEVKYTDPRETLNTLTLDTSGRVEWVKMQPSAAAGGKPRESDGFSDYAQLVWHIEYPQGCGCKLPEKITTPEGRQWTYVWDAGRGLLLQATVTPTSGAARNRDLDLRDVGQGFDPGLVPRSPGTDLEHQLHVPRGHQRRQSGDDHLAGVDRRRQWQPVRGHAGLDLLDPRQADELRGR